MQDSKNNRLRELTSKIAIEHNQEAFAALVNYLLDDTPHLSPEIGSGTDV